MEDRKTVAEVIENIKKGGDCLGRCIARDLGCERVPDCDVARCPECIDEWWGIFASTIERERAEAVSAAMDKRLREWAAENGLPVFHESEGFKQWLDRCFLPRPLYEDGNPVQFDGEVSHPKTGEAVRVKRMNMFYDGDFVLGFDSGNAVYSKGERVKRPDTQKSIEMDALLPTNHYWRCEDAPCDECPARVDGKNPAERYGTPEDCDLAMIFDLLRRQRELDKRTGGAE